MPLLKILKLTPPTIFFLYGISFTIFFCQLLCILIVIIQHKKRRKKHSISLSFPHLLSEFYFFCPALYNRRPSMNDRSLKKSLSGKTNPPADDSIVGDADENLDLFSINRSGLTSLDGIILLPILPSHWLVFSFAFLQRYNNATLLFWSISIFTFCILKIASMYKLCFFHKTHYKLTIKLV